MLFFNLLDMLLIIVMLFDTLGLLYQFRKKEQVNPKEYIRIYSSWILFLTIYNTFSCKWKGFFGTLIRLILLAAKVYVTIPIFGGSMKIHKIIIEDGKGEELYKRLVDLIKSKLCKGEKNQSSDDSLPSETVEPESCPSNNNLSNE